MNSISWFLYLAETIGTINVVSGIFLFLSISATCICGIIYANTYDCSRHEGLTRFAKSWGERFSYLSVGLLFLTILVPSQKTLYLILASEAGEEVVTSDTGQKALNVINQKLDEMLEETEG